MMRRLFLAMAVALLVIPLVATNVHAANDDANIWQMRWQNKAGWAFLDSLSWRAGAGRILGSCIDTLTAAGSDTSLPLYIDGVEAITFTQVPKKVVVGSLMQYKFEVSDDLVGWDSLTVRFSAANSATTPVYRRTTVFDARADSLVGNLLVNGMNQKRVAAASYMRVIAKQLFHSGTDSTIHGAIVKRRWPADPK